jgi:hypothetical protein
LGQIRNSVTIRQAPDSDALQVNHEELALPAKDIIRFEIPLPDAGIMDISDPQGKFIQFLTFCPLVCDGGQIIVEMLAVIQQFRQKEIAAVEN